AAIYRRLYEGVPQGKLELLARGLTNVQRFDGGLITLTHLTLDDFATTGADESYSEGPVDHLPAGEGTAAAGLVRDQKSDVAATRRRLGRGVKVGHAGTLDPFATGLLLVLVGRATRAQRFLMALPKRYETVARLGCTSSTGDPYGEIVPGRMPPEPLPLPT